MLRFLSFILCLLASCTTPNRIISYTTETKPPYPFETVPGKILVLNMYDVAAQKFRDNKEEVFMGIISNLTEWLAGAIREEQHIAAKALPGYTSPGANDDSTIALLLKKENATHAMVIRQFDVSFYQTRVEVTREGNGSKNREAFYDILAEIRYTLYSPDAKPRSITVNNRRFHSSRTVLSGLLAAGPSIVSKKEDAREMALDNGQLYLYYFFPGKAQRSRPLFTGKGFETVNSCVLKMDYECALTESLRLLDHPDTEKSSRAAYNCAVFFERKNQPEEARKYLQQSLSLHPLPEARQMQLSWEKEAY